MPRGRSFAVAVVGAAIAGGALIGCGGDDAAKAPAVEDMSPLAQEGATLARDLGCIACHAVDHGRATGPSWVGLAGSEVRLEGGTTVIADREYLERAILDPRSEVVAGYASVMPTTYELAEDELDAIIAFIEALGPD